MGAKKKRTILEENKLDLDLIDDNDNHLELELDEHAATNAVTLDLARGDFENKDALRFQTDTEHEGMDKDRPVASEIDMESPTASRYFYLLTFLSGLGGFLFGYDTGIVSGAQLLFVTDFGINDVQLSGIVSATVGGSIVGSILTYTVNQMFGRRPAVLIASFLCCLASCIMAAANSWHMLLVGRIIVGLGVGFESATIPMYIAETAPVKHRGKLTVSNSILLTGGQFIAGIIAGLFSKQDYGWRYMFGLGVIPAVIQFVGFLLMPESPRWLMGQDRREEAECSLRLLRGDHHPIESELRELEEDAAERLLRHDPGDKNQTSAWSVLRAKPAVRRALVLGCLTQFFQQFGGINTVMYYSSTIIRFAGVSNSRAVNIWLSAGVSFFNAAFTVVAFILVERWGRRKLMLISQVGVILSLILLSIAFFLGSSQIIPLGPYRQEALADPCMVHTDCIACTRDTRCGFCPTLSALGATLATGTACFSKSDTTWSDFCSVPDGVCPNKDGWLAVLALVLYLIFFAPGLGTMPWIINAEIYPLEFRHAGNSAATAVNWCTNLVVSFTFLFLVQAITAQGAFLFYVGITLIGLFVMYFILPETMGKNFEEISEMFRAGWIQAPIPWRKRK